MQAAVSVPARQRAVRLDAAGRLEGAAAFAACLAVSVVANARLLRPDVVSDDALVHQFWMRHWQDPALFNDPLTTQLRESVRYPDGYQALFWLAAHGFDPIAFGEWLGVGLMALSGWLVFRIVREQESWRPAAWIGAALFLSLLGIHRFAGGFPRAFVQPVVLLTVLLAMRGRNSGAAVVAGAGALFYPPAAVLAVGVLALSAVRGWRIDVRRAASGGVAAAILMAALLVPRLLAGGAPRVMSAAEARAFPEFGPHGTLPFFVDSLTRYLSQNRSGFDLRWAGSVLVVAGLVLLVARWRDVRALAPEVLAMPVASLGAFALAQLVLFQLYLPHRYTYPLMAFFAIAVAVLLRPLWQAAGRRGLALLACPAAVAALAVFAFPLAPRAAPRRRHVGRRRARRRGGVRRRPVARAGARTHQRRRGGHRRSAARADPGAPEQSAARQALPAVAGDRLPQQPAEGRRGRRRPAGPHVRGRERRAGRRDLREARALLRGRGVPGRPRPDVRGSAGRLRHVAGRDHRAEHALRRDTPVDPPPRRRPRRPLAPAPAPVRPLRPRPPARRRARVASPSGGVPAVAARLGRGLRPRLRLERAAPRGRAAGRTARDRG